MHTIAAASFVDFNLADTENEKGRLAALISALPQYPLEVRTKLANDLVQIAADRREDLGRRLQAASMLAYQVKRLGIKGSESLALAVREILETEFRIILQTSVFDGAEYGVHGPSALHLMFLCRITTAALFIDLEIGLPAVEQILTKIPDQGMVREIKWLIKLARKQHRNK